MDCNRTFCSFLKGVVLTPQAAYSRKTFPPRIIMTKQILAALFFCMGSVAAGEVSTRVCLADGNTPLEYTDIMVGTKLTMIVSSDVAQDWFAGGALVIEGEEMQNRGVLYGRDCEFGECPGSCLPDAGEWATVWETFFPGIGFDLGSVEDPNAGDWYIIDYNAIDIGDCNVTFYDYDISEEPVDILPFHHVRTRDFDNNTKVDFADFAILALYWQETDCNDPNWCEGTDLDIDGNVDSNDLMLFSDYWLETTQ